MLEIFYDVAAAAYISAEASVYCEIKEIVQKGGSVCICMYAGLVN